MNEQYCPLTIGFNYGKVTSINSNALAIQQLGVPSIE